MIVDLKPFQGIVLAHALKASYQRSTKHYAKVGVPDFAKQMTRDSLEAHEDAHKILLDALRACGYPMTNEDIEPVAMSLFPAWKDLK